MNYLMCLMVAFLSCEQRSSRTLCVNNEKVKDIEEVEIHNDGGKISIRNSGNDETTVDCKNGNVELIQENRKLIIRPIKKTALWGLISWGKRMDFQVNVSPSVKKVNVSFASKYLDVRDCTFDEISLKAATANVFLQNVRGNFSFSGATLKGILENVFGNINIFTSTGEVFYIMKNFFSPVEITLRGIPIKFHAFLCDSYKSIAVSGDVILGKSHLPFYRDGVARDLSVTGKVYRGSVDFSPISDLTDDVYDILSPYD